MGKWDANNNKLLSLIARYTSPKDGHQRIHEGVMFSSEVFRGEDNEVADNANIEMDFQTSTLEPHTIIELSSGGASEIFVFEGASTVRSSTLVVANRFRSKQDGIPSTVSCSVSSAVTPGGTCIFRKTLPGGASPHSTGASGKPFEFELVLKANTRYLLRGINRAGSAQPMSLTATWYESTD